MQYFHYFIHPARYEPTIPNSAGPVSSDEDEDMPENRRQDTSKSW